MTFNPTAEQRLILANQYEILALLDQRNGAAHRLQAKRLRAGFLDLAGAAAALGARLPASVHEEVSRILDMHLALYVAQQAGRVGDAIALRDIAFQGFDAVREAAYFDYAQHLIRDEGRHSESRVGSGRAAVPKLPRYRRMLQAWQQAHNPDRLTDDDVARIVAAGRAGPQPDGEVG